ncbi:MAG: hypothetical protein HC838_11955 [Spirulinaceae cyanobacterium RM2_2_10]|nr:hypothetical protein [Spirulinaceae cyanobacterium SM2_1_0]NJO20606.1 hypothetical protein [Spirulinaceae cyanobacterium RM2_2_10]
MFGSFQRSHLRLEVDATASTLAASLQRPEHFRRWLSPQQFDAGLPLQLTPDCQFTARLGPVAIAHRVQVAHDNVLRLLLSGAVDGYHEWYWGDGWVQSRLEAVSLLPLNLTHTAALWRLRDFAAALQTAA